MAVVKDSKQTSSVQRWFRETRGELRKVVWPTREEALRLTYIVIGTALFMGFILGLADLALSTLYSLFAG